MGTAWHNVSSSSSKQWSRTHTSRALLQDARSVCANLLLHSLTTGCTCCAGHIWDLQCTHHTARFPFSNLGLEQVVKVLQV